MNKKGIIDLNYYRKFFTFSKINYFDLETKAYSPEECTPVFVYACVEEKENFRNSIYEFSRYCSELLDEVFTDVLYRSKLYLLGMEKAFKDIEENLCSFCLIYVGRLEQNLLVSRTPKVIFEGKEFVVQNSKMIIQKLEKLFEEMKEKEKEIRNEIQKPMAQ